MQITGLTFKVSKRINKHKLFAIRNFLNTYQSIAKIYSSYILENNLHEKLINEVSAKALKNILHKIFYKQIKDSFNISSQTIQEIRDVVVETYNSWAKLYKQFLNGEIENEPSLPRVERFTVRMNYPRVVSIFEHGGEFPFFLKVKLNGTDKRYAIPIECGEYQRKMLKNALNGKYKIGAVQLVERDEWYYFVVPIKKNIAIPKKDVVIGVDIGLRHQAAITVLHRDGKISDVEFLKYRKLLDRIRYLWKKIDYLKSILPDGQRSSKQIRRLWRKIREINSWIAHNVSKRIVEVAEENNGMIALEDLRWSRPRKGTRRRDMNRKLANWIHGKIAEYTLYKANWKGIYVKFVNAKDTSRRCHICGAVGYRKGAIFSCCEHSYTSNADFNASVNIGFRAMFPKVWGIVNIPAPSGCKTHCVSVG
ncbi:MAG: transposase [Candidatus Odinarchaeota archaeon]|nr:transposase [Candidatus Odinarchaeota archaeon]